MDGQRGESKKEEVIGWSNMWVGNGRTGYQKEVDEEIKGVDSKDKVKHNERSDRLFLERMMSVAKQV